jgi:protein involved in polysaccharide export with SLBB domain
MESSIVLACPTRNPKPEIRRVIMRIVLLALTTVLLSNMVAAETAPEERVLVVGPQAKVTEVPYAQGMTASKAILAAGGYADFGQTPLFLVRCGEVTHLDMRAILERGQRDKDVPLKPWDVIVIGTTLGHRK